MKKKSIASAHRQERKIAMTGRDVEINDLTPEQKEVVERLTIRVRVLSHKGSSLKAIEQTLVSLEGWPIGAVRAAIQNHIEFNKDDQ